MWGKDEQADFPSYLWLRLGSKSMAPGMFDFAIFKAGLIL